ncbi:AI-2E family transporter [Chakrabartyella piscis]|uniref:AI-2E family transporter n=1 Tax=Chakrabartyella piscis TaxID=2918914 RepID=UPI0029587574|nr:AI-2E family transporter [Chakrabartyella piscis]
MKKFDFKKIDTQYTKIGFYIFLVAAAVILFEKVVGNLPDLSEKTTAFLQASARIGSPFIIGFALAYLLNPSMKFFERNLLKIHPILHHHRKPVRSFCILLNYLIFFGGITWIILYLVPELKDSFLTFIPQLPTYVEDLSYTISHFFDQIDFIDSKDVESTLAYIFSPLFNAFENLPTLVSGILTNLYSVGKITFDVIMAIFISFYMLLEKELFAKQGKKIVMALTSREKSGHILHTIGRINIIFQKFIVGKAFDSLIVWLICLVGFTLLNVPYTLVFSLILGVTNMIPYFGPFIGAIPVCLIILLINPVTAIWVIIFVIILQQFDGYYLGPKILGDSLDLSPIWIILAVVLGGSLGGAVGMFLGVPILATVKMFFSEYITKKYNEKY